MAFRLQQYLEKTNVSPVGANILMEMEYWLPFVADLTQRNVFFLTLSNETNEVLISAVAYAQEQAKDGVITVGTQLSLRHESIVSRVFEMGKPVYGNREMELGEVVPFLVYPLFDNAGLTFAAVGFIGKDKADPILIDCAWRLLSLPQPRKEVFSLEARVQDGVLIFNADTGRVVYANERGKRYWSWISAEPQQRRFTLDETIHLPLIRDVRQSRTIRSEEWDYQGRVMSGTAFPITNEGNVSRVLLLLTDVTLLREKEKELLAKDVVIQEIHHRVKNNLQTVASLLRMQGRRCNNETKIALHQAEQRIQAIASVHDILAKQINEKVDLQVLVSELVLLLQREWEPEVRIIYCGTGHIGNMSSEQALNVAMILHELVQNACEHSTALHSKKVQITLTNNDGMLCLSVVNAGKLLPENFSSASYHLGLQIVENLTKVNLNGSFIIKNEKNMVVALCEFPLMENEYGKIESGNSR